MKGLFAADKKHVKRMEVVIRNGALLATNGRITVRVWDANGTMETPGQTPVEVLFEDMVPLTAPAIAATTGAVMIERGQAAVPPVTGHVEVVGIPEVETTPGAKQTKSAILVLEIPPGATTYHFSVRCGNATYRGQITGCAIGGQQ